MMFIMRDTCDRFSVNKPGNAAQQSTAVQNEFSLIWFNFPIIPIMICV